MLSRLEDLGEALALGIDPLGEVSQDVRILYGILGGLNMVGADGFNNIVVFAVARFLGSPRSAKETVCCSFNLGIVAAGGADDSGTIVVGAGSVSCQMCVVSCRAQGRRIQSLLPDDSRYVLREFANTCTAKLENNPSPRQMLLFLVRYPLRLVRVPVDEC